MCGLTISYRFLIASLATKTYYDIEMWFSLRCFTPPLLLSGMPSNNKYAHAHTWGKVKMKFSTKCLEKHEKNSSNLNFLPALKIF